MVAFITHEMSMVFNVRLPQFGMFGWKGYSQSVLTKVTVTFAENAPKDSYNWPKLDSLSEII